MVPSAPGKPAALGPRLSPSLSPPLRGHQCEGETARSHSLRRTAESWFADPWPVPIVRRLVPAFPTPYHQCADCRGPFPGFLRQASGKLAFPGSRRGSRPGPCWENALEDAYESGGGGSRSTGWWGPWAGHTGLSGLTAPSPSWHAGRGGGHVRGELL